ncbi:MAG: hypothetical protein ACUVX9_18345 [Anaerolineae bacterium]
MPAPPCARDWTYYTLHQLIVGAPALPEIYATDGIHARQWALLDDWAPLPILGTTSQYVACGQKQCGVTNSPVEAHRQMHDALAHFGRDRAFPWAIDMIWNYIQ